MAQDGVLEFLETSTKKLGPVIGHPLVFGAGVGLANGLLARARGKRIDLPTAAVLAGILGLGEAALEYFTPPEKRAHSLTSIALWSVVGVAAGVAPFVDLTASQAEAIRELPTAVVNPLRRKERDYA